MNVMSKDGHLLLIVGCLTMTVANENPIRQRRLITGTETRRLPVMDDVKSG